MKALNITGRVLLFILAIGVGSVSLRYLNFEVQGILEARSEVLEQAIYYFSFYTHIFFSPLALIIGPFQFSKEFRNKYLNTHRLLGKIYVLCCLVGAITGFAIAFYTFGGWVSTIGFSLLGIFWFYTTLKAWMRIRQKNIEAHRLWMLRSYALTMAAVTLRLWLPTLEGLIGFDFITSYQIIAWLVGCQIFW